MRKIRLPTKVKKRTVLPTCLLFCTCCYNATSQKIYKGEVQRSDLPDIDAIAGIIDPCILSIVKNRNPVRRNISETYANSSNSAKVAFYAGQFGEAFKNFHLASHGYSYSFLYHTGRQPYHDAGDGINVSVYG